MPLDSNIDKLQNLLSRLQEKIAAEYQPATGSAPSCTLFFSFTDTKQRATVFTVSAANLRDAWRAGVEKLRQKTVKTGVKPAWIRVDWVENAEKIDWKTLKSRLKSTKRNYFRHSLALDRHFRTAFLETELNANAMLYGGPKISHAIVNEANFLRYAKLRHGIEQISFDDDAPLIQFSTRAVFGTLDSEKTYLINGVGRNAGRREVTHLQPDQIETLIEDGSQFLASQVKENGRFIYGWHPCFDREIKAYNSLRHASTLYSMIEAWEITQNMQLKSAIDRGLDYLTTSLIQTVKHNGQEIAVLVDANNEVKLGGNAVCLLALVKYSEVTGSDKYLGLLEKLALAILYMQDRETGKFVHVLNFPDLTVKEEFRIIYYDGEAAFGLMRLYGLTQDRRWLEAVERGYSYFIAADHWQAHDHWLAYATNELTRYHPRQEYFEFGIKNFADYLDFVANRITTFPTLLELMMAAEQMVRRLQNDEAFAALLAAVDLEKFYSALEKRAHYLLNGHFWPELAMFYANPQRIQGSFFIRHHAFRIRIDDVEHYLSGLVAYLKYRKRQ